MITDSIFSLIVHKIIMHFGINGALQSTKCESLGAYSGDSYRQSEGKFFLYFLKVGRQNSLWLSRVTWLSRAALPITTATSHM